jgi:hypothetical protein
VQGEIVQVRIGRKINSLSARNRSCSVDMISRTSLSLLAATLIAAGFISPAHAQPAGDASRPDDGYRGIWFTLGQFSEHGDKYSGGLGTYTANHIPLAVFAPEVNKTFFVYGGTIKNWRHLLIMASYYDHARHEVPRPTIVHDKGGVDDPHDNPSISIDHTGRIWVFISGRGRSRPGLIYCSVKPFDVAEFDFVLQDEFTYPQPHYLPGKGFFHLFTKYTRGRELFWATSPDGKTWSDARKLAGIHGHYQVSNAHDNKIAAFFNRHPGGSVDRRTDLYYAQTTDFGRTWTTVDGRELELPLTEPDNPARVIDYESQGRLQYTVDFNFDRHGNPLLLYVTSAGHQPGPPNDPREWTLTRWNGLSWETHVVTRSDHNYDQGSLYVTDSEWVIIGPTEQGPQPYGTGGEIALWFSSNEGKTWAKRTQITTNSEFNHAYARRPVNARDPFYVFWADGNPREQSLSRLYFGSSTGESYWQLPYDMQGAFATPIQMKR